MNPIRIERVLATKREDAFQVEVSQDIDNTQLVVGTGNTFGFLPESVTTRRAWPTFTRSILEKLDVLPSGELEIIENERGKKEVVNFNQINLVEAFKTILGKQARLVIEEDQKPAFAENGVLLNKPKLNPQTKMYLLKDGRPIFRKTVLVVDDSIQDKTIKHDSEVDEYTLKQILSEVAQRQVVML